MTDFFVNLLNTDGFVPRRVCGDWSPGHVWLHTVSDLLIWLAYLSIPLILVTFLWKRRRELPFPGLFALFAAFILCCGFTHLLDALMFTWPAYRLSGVMKGVTAVVSWVTVAALVPAVPRILTLLGQVRPSQTAWAGLTATDAGRPQRFVVAAALAGLALLGRFALDPVLNEGRGFVLPLVAVMAASWYGGFWPGALALLLGGGGFAALFVPVRVPDAAPLAAQADLALFVFCGVVAAALGQAQRSARLAADAATADLQESNRQLARSQWAADEALTQLDAFLAHAPVGLAFYDPDLRYLRINKYLADANRLPAAGHLGKTIPEALPNFPPAVVAELRGVLDSGKPLRDRVVLGSTGPDSVWHMSAYPARDPHGLVVGLAVVAQDVTDRVTQERAVQRSEARLRAFVDHTPDAMSVKDPQGRYTLVSPALAARVGRPVAAVLGKTDADLYPPDLAATFAAQDAEVRADGKTRRYDQQFEHNGRPWAFLTAKFRLPDGSVGGVGTDVTEQKAAGRAVAESAARFRTVVEAVPGYVWSATPDGAIDYQSPRVTEFTGVTAENLIGAGWLTILHPDDVAPTGERWGHSLRTGEPYRHAFRLRRRDGEYRWHDVQALPARDASGAVGKWYGYCADVHDHRAAADALAASQRRFRETADAAPAVLWETDPDGRCVFLSRGWVELTGQPVADGLGEGWLDMTHPDDLAATGAAFRAANDARTAFRVDYRVRRPDGSYGWATDEGRPRFGPAGDYQGMVGSVLDIDARKLAEDERRAGDERYRALFETMDQGYCVIEMEDGPDGEPDHDYRFLATNPAFDRHTGLPGAAGRSIRELAPGIESHWPAACGQVARTGRPARFEEHSLALGRWFDVYAARQGGPGSRRVAVLFTDITARKQDADRLAASEARFREMADAMPQIVYTNDAAGASTYLNRRWYEYTGLTSDDPAAIAAVIHPDDRDRLYAAAAADVAAGRELTAEFRLRRHDGAYRWFLTRSVPAFDAAGRVTARYGTSTDIDDRKRAEGELRASQDRLEFVLRSSGIGLWDNALPLGRLNWDERVKAHFHLPPDAEPDIDTFFDRLHPADREPTRRAVEAALTGGPEFDVDYRTVDPATGAERWVRAIGRPTVGPDGAATNFSGVTLDVTDRKRAEAAVRESEANARLALDVAQVGTWRVDPGTGRVEIDARTREITGVPAGAELVVADFAGRVHPDDWPGVQAALDSAADPAGDGRFALEYRFVHPDGVVRATLGRGQTEFAGDGPGRRPVVIRGTLLDITDRKRAEERQRLLAELAAETQPLTDPTEVAAVAARLLADQLGADRCAYATVDPDAGTFTVDGNHCRGAGSIVGRYPLAAFGEEFALGGAAGRPFVVADREADDRLTEGDRAAFRAADIRAMVCVPLVKGGRFAASLAVHQTVPRAWSRDEVELVREVAGRCWEAVERARVALELAASEARFRGLADTAPLAIFEADPTGAVTYMSRFWADFTGAPAADAHGDGWGALVRPDHLPRLAGNWWSAVHGAERFDDLFPLRHTSGRFRWVQSRAVLVRRPDGRPERWVGVLLDIHDRVEAEEALAATQRTLTMSLAAASAGVYAWDLAADKVTVRTADPHTPGALLATRPVTFEQWLTRIHPDDRDRVRVEVTAAREARTGFTLQFRVGTPDGGYRWVENRGQFEYGPDGIPQRLVGVRLDVHDRVTAEEAARRADVEFRAMADGIPQLAWMARPDGAIDWYNSRWYEYTGTTFEQMRGWGWQAVHDPAVLPEVMERWPAAIAAGTPFEMVFPLRGADGVFRPFLTRVNPVRDEAGHIVRWFGTNTDVTAQRQLEADLRAAGDRFRFLDELGQCTRAADARDTLAATCRRLGEHLRTTRVAYADMHPDGDAFTIPHDWTDGAATTVGDYSLARFGPTAVAELTAGRPLVVRDVDAELGPAGGADMFNAIGIKAVVCCPLVKGGRLVALMAVHQAAPRDWTVADIGLVTEVVERSWAHVERARAEDQARDAADRFRVLAESVPALVWSADAAGRSDYHSARWAEYTGRPAGEITDHGWNRSVHPDDLTPDRLAAWERSAATGEPFAVEYRLRRHDGAYRWHLSQARAQRDRAGRAVRWYGTVTDIDDQKRLEADLRQKTAILDTINDHTPTLVYVKDRAGRAVAYNPATLAAIGKAAEEVVGRTEAEFMPPGAAAAIMANDRRVLDRGEVLVAEERPDDTTDRTFLSVKAPHREDGAVVGLIGVSVDITTQKRLEREARAASDRFRTLTEAIPQMVWNADADGRVSYVNTRWQEYTGLTTDESGYGWWRRLGHPADLPSADAAWGRALSTETAPIRQEVRLRRAGDGAYRWFSMTVVPLRRADGSLDQWIGSLSDVHDMKTAEEAVRASEARFRNLVEAVPSLVWVTDADGQITQVNRQWPAYTGRPAADLLGEGYAEVIHPDDRAGIRAGWMAAVKHRTPYAGEFRLRRHDGQYRWHIARGLPVPGPDGRLSQWFGTTTDIDNQKRAAELLEREVRERTAELHRSNGELEKFAYVASHDLQEPLRKVRAFGDRLSTKFAPRLGPDGVDYVERMQASAARMQTLIDDLLAFARVTSKPKAFAPVALGKVVEGVLSDLEALTTRTGAVVEVGDLPTVLGEAGQWRQLFQNLIANACKFHKPGAAPTVRVGAERLDRLGAAADPPPAFPAGWRLTVGDDGIGFEQQYADRIFEVFQRLHGRGQYEGTGIGLAICRKIAERHGGIITARGRPGDGAVFAVDLPDPPAGAAPQ